MEFEEVKYEAVAPYMAQKIPPRCLIDAEGWS